MSEYACELATEPCYHHRHPTDAPAAAPIKWHGLHHVAVLCADLKKSMDFYQGMLGELWVAHINPRAAPDPHH